MQVQNSRDILKNNNLTTLGSPTFKRVRNSSHYADSVWKYQSLFKCVILNYIVRFIAAILNFETIF